MLPPARVTMSLLVYQLQSLVKIHTVVQIPTRIFSIMSASKQTSKHAQSEDSLVPDGDVVHDLSEHGWRDDWVTVTWQQWVMAFVNHFPLQ